MRGIKSKERRPCLTCGAEMRVHECNPNKKYCSLKCRRDAFPPSEDVLCRNCGKEFRVIGSFIGKRGFYCSTSCQLKYEYKTGTRDPYKTTEAAHIRCREMVANGTNPFQNPDVHIKAMRSLGSKNYGKTWIEEKMGWAMKQKGLNFESQYPVRTGIKSDGQPHFYFLDFAFPDKKIAVECDGIAWHTDIEREKKRNYELELLGWNVIHIAEHDIKSNLFGCADVVVDAFG